MPAEPTRPPRLHTPTDHALALHPAGLGRVALARRLDRGGCRETRVPVADLAYAVGQLRGEGDVYLTQNRFFGPRRVVRLAQLAALFADLDYHKTRLADAHPRHVLGLALEALARDRKPGPTFALATGRGLALVWLHSPVPRPALPRWRACQKAIHDALRPLGVDRLATDAARVLRPVGTRNARSGTPVKALNPVGDARVQAAERGHVIGRRRSSKSHPDRRVFVHVDARCPMRKTNAAARRALPSSSLGIE